MRHFILRFQIIGLVAVALATCGLVMGALVVSSGRGSPKPSTSSSPGVGFISPRRDGDPFLRGRRVTLAQAASTVMGLSTRAKRASKPSALTVTEAGLYLYEPNDALASPAINSTTWMQTSQTDGGLLTQIATSYSTGITIVVSNSTGIDYGQFVNSFEGHGQLVTLHGAAAVVVPENTDDAHQNMGIADLTLGDTRIVVMGHFPLSDIERVAGSLQ
jgi:hypothetical protein